MSKEIKNRLYDEPKSSQDLCTSLVPENAVAESYIALYSEVAVKVMFSPYAKMTCALAVSLILVLVNADC